MDIMSPIAPNLILTPLYIKIVVLFAFNDKVENG